MLTTTVTLVSKTTGSKTLVSTSEVDQHINKSRLAFSLLKLCEIPIISLGAPKLDCSMQMSNQFYTTMKPEAHSFGSKLKNFINHYLKRILRIFRPQISNSVL